MRDCYCNRSSCEECHPKHNPFIQFLCRLLFVPMLVAGFITIPLVFAFLLVLSFPIWIALGKTDGVFIPGLYLLYIANRVCDTASNKKRKDFESFRRSL